MLKWFCSLTVFDRLQLLAALVGLLSVVGWLAMWVKRRLSRPNIVICRAPYNHVCEPFLRWWHVDIENTIRSRWITTEDAKDCLVKFEFVPIGGSVVIRARGVWDSEKGPVEKKTIRAGEHEPPSPVALVVQSSQNYSLYSVPIEPGVVYVTGYQFQTQQNGREQLPAGDYAVKVIISSGQQVWPMDKFYLEIRGMGLGGFVLSERPGDL